MTATAEAVGSVRPTVAEAAVLVALGRAWDAIRERHPEVPPVILVVGPSPRRGRRHLLGCFRNFGWSLPTAEPTEIQAAREEAAAAVQRGDLAAAWQANADALYWSFAQLARESYTIVSEVFIATEVLEAGAEEVLAIMLHEAAHTLADRRGIKDTSRQGRYHNRRFTQLATKLGLDGCTVRDPDNGWSRATLPRATATSYSETLADLEQLLSADRGGQELRGADRRSSHILVCDCGRRVRCHTRRFTATAAFCGICQTPRRLTD